MGIVSSIEGGAQNLGKGGGRGGNCQKLPLIRFSQRGKKSQKNYAKSHGFREAVPP
jgi:hypothetical protein